MEINNNESIEIRLLEDPKKNWKLLREYSFESRALNPIASGMDSFHTDEGRAMQEIWLEGMVTSSNCPTVIAWDTEKNKIAGAVLMKGVNREIASLPRIEQPGSSRMDVADMSAEFLGEFKNVIAFFRPIHYDVLAKHPDIDWYAEIHSLGVLTEYSKRGIGFKLLTKALSVLQDLGYPLAFGNFVSSFSIKIAKKLDFQRVSGHTYKDNYPDYHKMPEHVQSAHKECLNMIKVL